MNIHELIGSTQKSQLKNNVPDIRVGETVKVHYKIREGNKERIQVFEGLVVATKSGKTLQGSFTVRKVVSGIGVERTFPLHSPWIIKIERTKSGKVRRAKLNYVRRYARSSKFKLKDKGKAGTVWEEIAEQKAEAEEAAAEQEQAEVAPEVVEEPTVAEVAEKAEDSGDDTQVETAGESGGESGSDVAAL